MVPKTIIEKLILIGFLSLPYSCSNQDVQITSAPAASTKGRADKTGDLKKTIPLTPYTFDLGDATTGEVSLDEDQTRVLAVIVNKNPSLTFTGEPAVTVKTNPNKSKVTLQKNNITITPNENYFGDDSFTLEACDVSSSGLCSFKEFKIKIKPVNDAPVAQPINISITEDQPSGADIDFTKFISDVDDKIDSLQLQVAPLSGLTISALRGHYSPAENANGSVSTTYQISDAQGVRAQGTINILIAGIEDPTVFNDSSLNCAGVQGTTITCNVIANDGDGPVAFGMLPGSFNSNDRTSLDLTTFASKGVLRITPDPGFYGPMKLPIFAGAGASRVDKDLNIKVRSQLIWHKTPAQMLRNLPSETLTASIEAKSPEGNAIIYSTEVVSGSLQIQRNSNHDGGFVYDLACQGTDPCRYQIIASDGYSEAKFDGQVQAIDLTAECGLSSQSMAESDFVLDNSELSGLPFMQLIGQSMGVMYKIGTSENLGMVSKTTSSTEATKFEIVSSESLSTTSTNSFLNAIFGSMIGTNTPYSVQKMHPFVSDISTNLNANSLSVSESIKFANDASNGLNKFMCATRLWRETTITNASNKINAKVSFSPPAIGGINPYAPLNQIRKEIGTSRTMSVVAKSSGTGLASIDKGDITGQVSIKEIPAKFNCFGQTYSGDFAYEITNDFPNGAYSVGLPKKRSVLLDTVNKKIIAVITETDMVPPAGTTLMQTTCAVRNDILFKPVDINLTVTSLSDRSRFQNCIVGSFEGNPIVNIGCNRVAPNGALSDPNKMVTLQGKTNTCNALKLQLTSNSGSGSRTMASNASSPRFQITKHGASKFSINANDNDDSDWDDLKMQITADPNVPFTIEGVGSCDMPLIDSTPLIGEAGDQKY
jgi:hypothetical protein